MPRDGRREARGAPEPRPSADVWLDSVSPSITKPSPEELGQWDLDERGNLGRSFFLTTVVLRATSLIAALAVVIICLIIIGPWESSSKDLIPVLIACFVSVAWDAGEFGIMLLRGGQGLPWWLHIAADWALFTGIAIATGFSFARLPLILETRKYYYYGSNYNRELACFGLSVLLIVIHFSLVVLFLFSHIRGRAEKQRTEPRIMYLPTGDPVVVTREPVVPPAVATAPPPRPPTPPRDPGTADRIHEPFRRGIPPRKPVAGAPVGATYASPWPGSGPGPDYQPDEAERARAARGELQAQCMMIQEKGLRHEKVVMENATGRRADQMSSTGGSRT